MSAINKSKFSEQVYFAGSAGEIPLNQPLFPVPAVAKWPPPECNKVGIAALWKEARE